MTKQSVQWFVYFKLVFPHINILEKLHADVSMEW